MEWRVSSPPPPFALRQTIAFAVHLQNVDVVGEAVEQGAGQPLTAEDLGPFVEWQIAGHQRGAALVALARSSFMMISSMLVTSNAETGCLLQVPLPQLAVPDAERLVLPAANAMP